MREVIINSIRFRNKDIRAVNKPVLVAAGQIFEGSLIEAENGWKEALFEMSNDQLKAFISNLQSVVIGDVPTEGNENNT